MESIILARVSTKEQEDGHSIDAQVSRLQEYCLRKKLKIIKIFKIIESSTRGNRKEFHEMLDFAKSQKETVAIVCDAVDRFQRSFKETVLLDEYRNKGDIELHFSREGLVINRDSSGTEILMWNMSVLMANSYTLSLSDNVKRSVNYKINNGQWIGRAPTGYINNFDPTTGSKNIKIDIERVYLVRKLFETYSQGGVSVRALAEMAKKWGLTSYSSSGSKPLTRSQIHKMIQNPFYYGKMLIKGKIYQGIHEPLISKELFDICQDVRTGWKKKPFKYKSKNFLFRGLISCAHCGCAISSEIKKSKYIYLCCTKSKGPCEGMRVREEIVLDQLEDLFKDIHIAEEVVEEVRKYLKDSAESKREFHIQAISRIREEYNLIQDKLDRLLDLRIDGSITQEDFDRKCTQLKDKQLKLNQDLESHTDADQKFNNTLLSLMNLVSKSHQLFKSSEVEQKRQLLNLLVSNLSLRGTTIDYEIKKPFSLFTKRASCSEMLRQQDSNLRQSG